MRTSSEVPRRVPRWRQAVASIAQLPLALRGVLFAIAVLHAVGLSWGMPASDAWDVDGVAPRDFLPGLAATYSPGDFYTYPPLHLAILAVLTAPVTALAALHAKTTSVPDVLREILQPAYMTAMTMTARVVAVVMSLGVVLALAKISAELVLPERRKNTAVATAIAAGAGLPFTYYAHVTNLDVPYNFWASLAALGLVRAIARREPRRLRSALVLAALAITTKDQAYALFLLGVPLGLGAWLAMDAWARGSWRAIARELAIGAGFALVVLLVVDGAFMNPSGFRARLAFLSGAASQDFATYGKDLPGRLRLLLDLGGAYGLHYPLAFAALYVAGLVFVLRDAVGATRAAAAVPFALALSFTVCFNFVARRVEERFTLPQVLLLSVYAGIALARLWELRAPGLRVAARLACGAIVGWSVWRCVELDANLVLDPRYRAEAWLRSHVGPSDTIETYGLNVYLPRFPDGAHVVRVGATAPERRGPIPGLEELRAPLLEIGLRRPRFVVVSECYSWRFIPRSYTPLDGRIIPPTQQRLSADDDGMTFFDRLFVGKMGYDLVAITTFEHPVFRRVEMHASVSCPMYILERHDAAR